MTYALLITTITRCKHCGKAIAEGDMWDDWLHFVATDDDHLAEPVKSIRDTWAEEARGA